MLAKKPKNRFDNLTNVISSIESLLSASKPLDTKKNKSLFDFFTGKSSNWA
jgi:hypothetical protein